MIAIKFRQPISLQELFLPTKRMNSEGMTILRVRLENIIILFSKQALFKISCNNLVFLEVNLILMVSLILAFSLIRISQFLYVLPRQGLDHLLT